MNGNIRADLPELISGEVFRYLEHTVAQVSIRELARHAQCHPSTVSRQLRRLEQAREDPLIDGALQRLSDSYYTPPCDAGRKHKKDYYSEGDAAQCLTLLTQPTAVLAAGRDMPKVVIVRGVGEDLNKTVVDRCLAEVLALLDWITCFATGRVFRYRISREGREALARLIAAVEGVRRVREETPTQSGVAAVIAARPVQAEKLSKRARYGQLETPIQTLARLTDRNGEPFLTPEMVSAGERLREDFELAQIGRHVAMERANFVEPGESDASRDFDSPARQAFQRASSALCALGPGLSDIALKCCCHLDGLEAAERDLGWSARSGKIVLRIALEQLHHHYLSLPPQNQMIG